MTLEDLINEAEAKGLTRLTLYKLSEGRWQIARSFNGVAGYLAFASDPVSGIQAALGVSEKTKDNDQLELDVFE
jgi:hypothetical protein